MKRIAFLIIGFSCLMTSSNPVLGQNKEEDFEEQLKNREWNIPKSFAEADTLLMTSHKKPWGRERVKVRVYRDSVKKGIVVFETAYGKRMKVWSDSVIVANDCNWFHGSFVYIKDHLKWRLIRLDGGKKDLKFTEFWSGQMTSEILNRYYCPPPSDRKNVWMHSQGVRDSEYGVDTFYTIETAVLVGANVDYIAIGHSYKGKVYNVLPLP
ncbi:hypothetical protein GW765_02835 [Candidatus Parcubacteria bacterium]|nr:hypothetical protein [Candidatus Parcubacteria bacterium]